MHFGRQFLLEKHDPTLVESKVSLVSMKWLLTMKWLKWLLTMLHSLCMEEK